MATELLPGSTVGQIAVRGLPALPWRDPQAVPKDQLLRFIAELEETCRTSAPSADLQTCLGIAHAMNLDVYRSMDALEEAVRIDGENFLARLKLGELFLRLRVLGRAEEETRYALALARNHLELDLARRQLQSLRDRKGKGLLRTRLSKPLFLQASALLALLGTMGIAILWLR